MIRIKERVGETYGFLKILDYQYQTGNDGKCRAKLYCECLNCGNKKWMYADAVLYTHMPSCGCKANYKERILSNDNARSGTGEKNISLVKDEYIIKLRFNKKDYTLYRYKTIDEAVRARNEGKEHMIAGDFLEWYEKEKTERKSQYRKRKSYKKKVNLDKKKVKQKKVKQKKVKQKKTTLTREEYQHMYYINVTKRKRQGLEPLPMLRCNEYATGAMIESNKKTSEYITAEKEGKTQREARLFEEVGNRYGKLTIKKVFIKGRYNRCVCDCDCGKRGVEVNLAHLKSGFTRSCGCLRQLDLTGKRFGRLVAIEKTGQKKSGAMEWKCQCDCGNIVYVSLANLRSGNTQSCGCKVSETSKEKWEERLKSFIEASREGTNEGAINKKEPNKTNKIGVKNVHYVEKYEKYFVQMQYKGEHYYLGQYKDLEQAKQIAEEAHEARLEGRLKEYAESLKMH